MCVDTSQENSSVAYSISGWWRLDTRVALEYFTLRGQCYTRRIGVDLHKNSGVAWSTSYQWCGLHQYFTPREPLVHVDTKDNGGVAYTRVWLDRSHRHLIGPCHYLSEEVHLCGEIVQLIFMALMLDKRTMNILHSPTWTYKMSL